MLTHGSSVHSEHYDPSLIGLHAEHARLLVNAGYYPCVYLCRDVAAKNAKNKHLSPKKAPTKQHKMKHVIVGSVFGSVSNAFKNAGSTSSGAFQTASSYVFTALSPSVTSAKAGLFSSVSPATPLPAAPPRPAHAEW